MKFNIKNTVKKHPLLAKWARIMKNPGVILSLRPKFRLKGKGNIIKYGNSSIQSACIYDIIGDTNKITIGESCILNGVVFFVRGSNNKITISNGVRFNRGGSIWIEDIDCELVIGSNSTFEDVHIAVTEPKSSIKIGDDCMFANDIDIRTGDSHSIIDTISNKRINYAQNIHIGNHVWVAAHVSILKGVEISDGSIVATRSVVTKKFEKTNIIIGGAPSKEIKENISWDRRRSYK